MAKVDFPGAPLSSEQLRPGVCESFLLRLRLPSQRKDFSHYFVFHIAAKPTTGEELEVMAQIKV